MLTPQSNSLCGVVLGRCRGPVRLIAFITDDKELPRLLTHLGLPTDFPIIAPPRSPPTTTDEDSQLDPIVDAFDGIDELPGAEPFPA